PSTPNAGGMDFDAAALGKNRSRQDSDAVTPARRSVSHGLSLSSFQTGLARRNGARLSLPVQLLLGLAALRPVVSRAGNRTSRRWPGVGRGQCLYRRRSLLESSSAESRARRGSEEARRAETLDPRSI